MGEYMSEYTAQLMCDAVALLQGDVYTLPKGTYLKLAPGRCKSERKTMQSPQWVFPQEVDSDPNLIIYYGHMEECPSLIQIQSRLELFHLL